MICLALLRLSLRLLAFALALSSAPVFAAEAGAAAPAVPVPPARQMRTLTVQGTAYERGRQHGAAFRSEIAVLVERWQQNLAREGRAPADVVLRRFLAATNFEPAIRRWTPDLLEEVRGIAAAAGQPFETMLAYQLGDEFYGWLEGLAREHCSAIGVAPAAGQPALIAQNMDIEPFFDGFQTVLRIAAQDGAPEQLVLTYPGLIGLNGLSDRPIAVACNSLLSLAASAEGLPQAFVLRGLLAQRTAGEALAFLRTVRHASGQNYLVGAADGVVDLEASAAGVTELLPYANGVLLHTNHPLRSLDLKPGRRSAIPASDTAIRLADLERRLARSTAIPRADDLLAALRARDTLAHPVCRPVTAKGVFTFSTVLMTLGDEPVLFASPGPSDVYPLERFTFATAARRN